MVAKAVMFQGTGSDVGKSLIVAGLARLLANRGYRVKPFKPQNMSNNAAVTVDGGEIGRAQALQAKAARVAPTVDMNPILLKPQSQTGAQVVVRGRVLTSAKARDYQKLKPTLLEPVLESFTALKSDADFVLVEGAGSASEINLRENDIANMGFARRAGVPVVLIGDIDRGGVIASLVGTQAVVEPEDAALIRGFIINRMRGDISLFHDGVAAITDKTGWQSIGIVPYFDEAHKLPAEDALALRDQSRWQASGGAKVRIAVLAFQHIANFDDVDPLQQDPNIDLVWVQAGDAIPAGVDLVILPGSKATIADLGQLYSEGWDVDLRAHARRGGAILGLCGGYQILGETLSDPEGIEGPAGSQQGLGLLPVATTMSRDKKLVSVKGHTLNDGLPFEGYEMHMGQTTLQDGGLPMVKFSDGRTEGAVSPCGLISGTYAHGFFANDRQRAAWVKRLSGQEAVLSNYDAQVEAALDGLAQHFEQHLDIEALIAIAQS